MPVFPKNNLPIDSLNWGREVEKSINNLETTFKSAEVNNVTRDAQLQNSYKRLDGTVTQVSAVANQAQAAATAAAAAALEAGNAATAAQDAVDAVEAVVNNIYVEGTEEIDGAVLATNTINGAKVVDGTLPGGKITANTITSNEINTNYVYAGQINAGQINAGYIQGLTFATGSSGTRVEATASNITFYGPSGAGGSISGNYLNGNAVNISSNGYLVLNGNNIANGGLAVTGGSLTVNDGNISSANTISGGTVSGTTGTFTTISNVSTPGSVIRTALSTDGLGVTGASLTGSGALVRTSSSARYKQDIQDLDISYEAILGLEPKTFRRIDEVEEKGDAAKVYAGFIAEDLADSELDIFAFYKVEEDGSKTPEGVHYPELTAALVLALKHQDQLIKSLTARIEALEA